MLPDNDRISSPCKSICQLNAFNVCIGCFRTVEEIAKWAGMSKEEKGSVLENIKVRKEAVLLQEKGKK